jgi:hypothetical protein
VAGMDAASLALVRAVPDAMASVGSARFRRVSARERRVPLVDDQDLTAEGVTDFASRATRRRWRALGTSLSEVIAAQRTPLLAKAEVGELSPDDVVDMTVAEVETA